MSRRWRTLLAVSITALLAIAFTAASAVSGPSGVAGAAKPKPTLLPPAGDPPPPKPPPAPPAPKYPPLPDGSGEGRRIVYSLEQQRVWIVEADNRVSGSWLVSGRKSIPQPGTYSIYSRSRWSSSGDVRMEFMMRFTKASTGVAIGFHAIPVDENGEPIQSEEELGQPRSRGCVRQARSDAEHLWNWAPDGTTVQVTA